MANAAFTNLASQAAITVVNNKGNIGKSLSDLVKSDIVKATIAAALTAGAMAQLNTIPAMAELGVKLNSGQAGPSEKLTYNLINAGGRALTNTAINGGNLEEALKQALVGGLVDTAHGAVSSQIKAAVFDYLAHKLAHALAECVAGAAAGGAYRDGAIGAAVGEIIAGPGGLIKPRNGMFYIEEEKRNALGLAKLVGGAVSAYAGGNAQTAITTAEAVVTSNAFFADWLALALRPPTRGGVLLCRQVFSCGLAWAAVVV
ncbi:MAG: DUF637 domain-containing protein [Hydrogenophaga sp.]|uniref:DUF637 domain-containing protein n=1 Tax=Hydrogenophaga sp. TaxID=1904254 RepID=UPI00272825FA|nr:DUF637 domain-containing protein [Hydrogenophaga sp.]MDO9571258.1 DUF637 domain-containing protein [Hydrogenophaga sp.]